MHEPAPAPRPLHTFQGVCKILNVSPKTLRGHVRAGDIRFLIVGKRQRRFTDEDINEFIQWGRQKCQFGNHGARHTSSTNSSGRVLDFGAVLEQRAAKKQRLLRR